MVTKNQLFLLPDGSTEIKHIQIFTYEHYYDNIVVELILHHKQLFESVESVHDAVKKYITALSQFEAFGAKTVYTKILEKK